MLMFQILDTLNEQNHSVGSHPPLSAILDKAEHNGDN